MRKLFKKINKDKIDKFILKIPYIFILLIVIILPPLGVYGLVIKVTNNKRKLYHNKRMLMTLGVFVFFIVGVGIYREICDIIELYDSGMSLDMINFIPDNLYLYIIGIIMFISYIVGARALKKYSKREQVYTKLINIEHITSIEEISNQLNISVTEAKRNIKQLIDKEFIIKVRIDDKNNTLLYDDKKKKASSKELSQSKTKSQLLKCHKCGAFVPLKEDEYVECDLCGNGLIEFDNSHN